MKDKIMLDNVFSPSVDVVARKIEGETIIIPIVAGIGDLEDDLYTLNETGQAIWEKLDGEKSIQVIIEELGAEYQAPLAEIQEDVLGIIGELARRKIIISV
ncbi:MAG: PqqD family protein [Candidatus Aminicenantes bacterium]|nr:PqqD family protein [Candidatus Aminicenantes bacterium]